MSDAAGAAREQRLDVLRAGLLAGVRVQIDPAGSPLAASLAALGASVVGRGGEHAAAEDAGAAAAVPDALVYDCREPFAAGGRAGLSATLEQLWVALHPVAERMIAAERGGRILLIAPSPGAELAEAARAGVENLARTLSIEWARYSTSTVAISPGAATEEHELEQIVAYLLSPAGGYFSGCRLALA